MTNAMGAAKTICCIGIPIDALGTTTVLQQSCERLVGLHDPDPQHRMLWWSDEMGDKQSANCRLNRAINAKINGAR
jgi:hypothetical protein